MSCPKQRRYPLQSSMSKSRQPYGWSQMSRMILAPCDLNSAYNASASSIQTYASQAPPSGSTSWFGRFMPGCSSCASMMTMPSRLSMQNDGGLFQKLAYDNQQWHGNLF